MPSLFTRLITGELPGEFVFKDRLWVALLDIAPANPGHCLLVPVHEAQYLAQLPAETLVALGPSLNRLISAVKGATSCPAVNVLVNDGPEANQAVPHAHVHVIPRHTADGKLIHPKGSPYQSDALKRMAEKLRAAAG
ncbi:MAG: HIT family protein [Planctomycetes bacterium]|nr:HIT family protein [Planctomycetota bacterium]